MLVAVVPVRWWTLALRGVAAILFSILAFSVPGITLAFLVVLFGIYALLDGVLALISAVRAAHGHRHWGAFLAEGIVDILAGLFTLFVPGLTLVFLVYLVGAWAVVTGIMELSAAMRLRQHVAGEWLLVLTGIVSILFGILVFWAPIAGALVIAWWLAAYALVFGVLLLTLAFRLRSLHRRLSSPETRPA